VNAFIEAYKGDETDLTGDARDGDFEGDANEGALLGERSWART
jgi:hypothetical protein